MGPGLPVETMITGRLTTSVTLASKETQEDKETKGVRELGQSEKNGVSFSVQKLR